MKLMAPESPLVMIHAGVADSRQWNNEFAYFSQNNQVIRYDMRGYGKSEPAEGEYSHMNDLVSLLDDLGIHDTACHNGLFYGWWFGNGFCIELSIESKGFDYG